jgi:hypothetical protein
MEIAQLQELLSMGGDSATIYLVFILWKLDRRLHNVEVVTGIKKLVTKSGPQ